MLRYLVLEPARYRNPGLGWLRFWQLLHDRTNGAFNDLYVGLSRLWQPQVKLPVCVSLPEAARRPVIEILRRDGCAVLPIRLSGDDISALRAFAFTTPAYSGKVDETIGITETRIPNDQPMYRWRTSDLIESPVVKRVVIDGPFAAIAQDYLGCRPLLSTLTLWLNPAYAGSNDQFVYHYDNDGPRFLKFFIYLSDMDVGTGAHYFIKGTHGPKKPPAFARSRRCSEGELLAHYGRDREYVASGPAGMILAEDTMGFHRGSAMTQGYRLLLQLQYSVIDIATEEDLTRAYEPAGIPGLDPAVARIHRKFWRRG